MVRKDRERKERDSSTPTSKAPVSNNPVSPHSDKPRTDISANSEIIALIAARFFERKTPVNRDSEHNGEFNKSGYIKVPLREETIIPRTHVLPARREITYCPSYDQYEGTHSTLKAPIEGVDLSALIANFHDMDATYFAACKAEWQSANWYKSVGGRTYYVLANSLRSIKSISTDDLIKMIMCILRYLRMYRATARFMAYNAHTIDGWINYMVTSILSSSGGSAIYSTRNELMSQLILNSKESFQLPELLPYLLQKPGVSIIPYEFPWTKQCYIVPWMDLDLHHMACWFDGWIGANQWIHPETYLKTNSLWKKWCSDFIPNIFNKVDWNAHLGIDITEAIRILGWSPVTLNVIEREWVLTKFFLHPFDDVGSGGTPELTLPVHGLTDVVTVKKSYYWDANEFGNTFYISSKNFNPGVYSPWFDPELFCGYQTENYSSATAAGTASECETLKGAVNFAGSALADMDRNEFIALFKRLAFTYRNYSDISDGGPIDLNGAIGSTANWFELMEYFEQLDKVPMRMPEFHWYENKTLLRKAYATLFNVGLFDIQQYKYQREELADSVGASHAMTEGMEK